MYIYIILVSHVSVVCETMFAPCCSMLVAWDSLVCLYLLSSHETKLTCVCSLIAPLRTWVQRYTRNSGLCAMLKLIHTYMCIVILLGNWCNWWLGMLLVQTTSSYLWCGLSWNVSLVRTMFLEVHQFHAKTETNRRPKSRVSTNNQRLTEPSLGGRFTSTVLVHWMAVSQWM